MKSLIAILAFVLTAPVFADSGATSSQVQNNFAVPPVNVTKPCTSYTKECTPIYSFSGPGFSFGRWYADNECIYIAPEKRIYTKDFKAWFYISAHAELDQQCVLMRAIRGYQELNRIDPDGKPERDRLMVGLMCNDTAIRNALNTVKKGFCDGR